MEYFSSVDIQLLYNLNKMHPSHMHILWDVIHLIFYGDS